MKSLISSENLNGEEISKCKEDLNLLGYDINNESFEFESDGNYYKNDVIDCLIKFENDSLLFIKNGEMENELYIKNK